MTNINVWNNRYVFIDNLVKWVESFHEDKRTYINEILHELHII